MTRSVEIPEEAVEVAREAYRASACALSANGAMRAALAAALPYLAPACQGDGVCTNPTCPTHGIEWDVPAGDGGLREALEKLAARYDSELGTVSYQWLSEKTLKPLLAAHPAAPAVPQPAGDSVRDALALLVQLKDGPRDQVYYDTRDEAWQSAREALAAVPQPVDREALEAIVPDEFAGQGGLGDRVLIEGAARIADAVLAVLAGEQEQVER